MRLPLRLAAVAVLVTLAHPVRAQRTATAQSLDTVRVTTRTDASLVTSTRSVEVITRDELARRASRSLSDLLGFALGVDVQPRSPAQADLGLRGSTFNQVVILVDGVRVSDAQSGHYALDLAVPTSMIERIEILRGTGSALYGSDAIGGVVNIVTRTDSSFGEVATRVGSFGGASGTVAAARSALGSPMRIGADIDRSSGHRDGTDYRITNVRGSTERALGVAHLSADVGLGVRQFGAADFYSPYPSFETTRSTTAALRMVAPLGASVRLSAAAHARRHSDVFTLKREDPAFYQNAHLSWQSGVESAAELRLSPVLAAAIGGELFDARLRSARLGDHEEQRQAAFAEATVGRAGGATLNAGLRGDWSSTTDPFASPSVAIAVPLGRAAQLRASSGRGYRAPNWTERYYRDPANIGDSTLRAERFTAHEIGLRLAAVRWFSADVAIYERRAESLIDWARASGSSATVPWRTMNFASATYRGAEGAVMLPALLGIDWTLRGSGLRFDASADPGTTGKYALRPMTRTLGVSAATRIGAAGSVTVDAQRAQRAGETDHLLLDARVTQSVAGMRLSLELLNLANADYLDGSGKPVAPRSVFLGLGWSAP
ncbi:MAG TPA: TonB-dependent receptor [Gemmatimonadaceae bacterium]|nr:TonB-dependent receptor [Gemmatimonadaceae bacterium]